MRGYGVAAAALNSAADSDERREIYDGLESGKRLRLLYVAPGAAAARRHAGACCEAGAA